MDETIRTFLVVLVLAVAVAAALLALVWLTPQHELDARAPIVTQQQSEPERTPEKRTIVWPGAQPAQNP